MKPLRFQRFRRLGLRGWQWHWRCVAGNNRIVFSSESFNNRGDITDILDTIIEKIKADEYVREDV